MKDHSTFAHGCLAAAAALLGASLGCSPGGPASDAPLRPEGSLTLALRTEALGAVYRLRDATFEVTGAEEVTLWSETAPDAPLIRQSLRSGAYRVALQPNWRLERSTDGEASFATVMAELTSHPSKSFNILGGRSTPVSYQFRVAGRGDLELSIEVVDDSVADASSADAAAAADASPSTGGDSQCELPPVCTNDLSNIGTGDFTIGFRIASTVPDGMSAILAQRLTCSRGQLWYATLNHGHIGFTLDDGANFASMGFVHPVNDGAEHTVRICRTAGTIRIVIDGEVAGMLPGNMTSFGLLPPVQAKTNVCVGVDATKELVGTLSDVCIGPR
jgi:hypothetical protein